MSKKGQSTIEYILLVTAVVAVVIFLTTGQNSMFQQRLANTINITTNGMETMANRLTNSAVVP
ncbi:MAG: class III signal peptide-containing protein [Candidatus Omnitrophica bacterium]|nr:class III signal peptide-containing protein [Candidatus Omnitrophota bacterium]